MYSDIIKRHSSPEVEKKETLTELMKKRENDTLKPLFAGAIYSLMQTFFDE